MNEQLQQALTALLGRATTGVDFLVAELPEVVQQLLLWKAVESALCMTAGLVLLIVCAVATVRSVRQPVPIDPSPKAVRYGNFKPTWIYDDDGDVHGGVVLVITVLGLGYISGLGMAINFDWLQIWIAPKVYLIEYAASLAK